DGALLPGGLDRLQIRSFGLLESSAPFVAPAGGATNLRCAPSPLATIHPCNQVVIEPVGAEGDEHLLADGVVCAQATGLFPNAKPPVLGKFELQTQQEPFGV